MKLQTCPIRFLLLLFLLVSSLEAVKSIHFNSSMNRSKFPPDFLFGTASSAYQNEGGANEGGRRPSIWDTFTRIYPGKIKDGSNGSVAVDSYHRYKEDVAIMKEMGLDAYRFSISWSRILPNGKRSGGVNMEGVTYYNNLINELIANGIKPFVTLFHWDLPQTLEDEYKGFLSRRIINDFQDYAKICFKYFGDRVKHWITLNEPWSYIYGGYTTGSFAPGRCSEWQQSNCIDGDSATEPYVVAHHLLLAHAAAVKSYRKTYQVSQKGMIGMALVSNWFIPYSAAKHNKRAAQRALDFMFGLFMDPLTNGDYPRSIRSLVPDRLLKFTKLESKTLNGSFDFLGLNYYTARYASYAPEFRAQNSSYITDSCVKLSSERDGVPIGPMAASEWLYVYPKGIYRLLLYIKSRYRNPIIYITENGVDEADNASLPLSEALSDDPRVQYHIPHLRFVLKAIKDGTNVKGYFVWSLLDNFEWRWGYTVRFGMVYVDFRDGLKRFPKLSSKWLSYFLKH